MKSSDLRKIRSLVNKEVERRKRINELLENEFVKEYLIKTNSEIINLDAENVNDILKDVLKTIKIDDTNGIYVCTCAYVYEYNICYQELDCYHKYVPINSELAEYKKYMNIESGKYVECVNKAQNGYEKKYMKLISSFEKENIVLNPYNSSENSNGYNEVRMDFFSNSLEYGQPYGKRIVLSKYNRI